MKLLLDTCVWGGLRTPLKDAGHDTVWAGDWPEDPGDVEILDRDFGELAVVRRTPHGGILRLVALSTAQQVAVCLAALERYSEELEAGAIVTAETGRIRIRPPDRK